MNKYDILYLISQFYNKLCFKTSFIFLLRLQMHFGINPILKKYRRKIIINQQLVYNASINTIYWIWLWNSQTLSAVKVLKFPLFSVYIATISVAIWAECYQHRFEIFLSQLWRGLLRSLKRMTCNWNTRNSLQYIWGKRKQTFR